MPASLSVCGIGALLALLVLGSYSPPAGVNSLYGPFRQEVANLHAVRRAIRELDDAGREAFIHALIESEGPTAFARRLVWLFLGGRGAGKSRSMSAAVHTAVRAGISAFTPSLQPR